MKILETKRLTLREFTIDDAPFISELLNSPGWLNNIGSRNIAGLNEAGKYIIEVISPSYEKNGFGFYMMETKGGTPVGMCGLVKRESLEDVDIGFAILPEYEGQGYTSEAALATMEYAKTSLKLRRIAAITVPHNSGSICILKKLGMTLEKMIRLPDDDEELMLFAVNNEN